MSFLISLFYLLLTGLLESNTTKESYNNKYELKATHQLFILVNCFDHKSSKSSKSTMNITKVKNIINKNLLTILTLIGVITGIILGLTLRQLTEEKWTSREIMYLNFIGDLFLRMLKSLILPLIVTSLIAAIGSLDLSLSGKIGFKAISYYLTTTFMAVILGIILVILIKPGVSKEEVINVDNTIDINQTTISLTPTPSSTQPPKGVARNVTTVDTLLDLLRNLFPPNLVQACTEQYQTLLIPPKDKPDERKCEISLPLINDINVFF